MSIRSGTKVFILCFLAILLTFFGGAAFGATNPYGTTITEGMWAQDGATDNNDGTISTTSPSTYHWGMRATNGSTINNRYRLYIPFLQSARQGTIITTSDSAYGMWAEQNSTANNNYRITTSGNHAYGMYAAGGSTINNNYVLLVDTYIRTSGYGSHAMVAEGSGSTAWNYADIRTTGDSAYGMWATDGAQAYNIGINVLGFSVAGSIETEGEGSHGMVAEGLGSIAANVGSIETSGMNALGMNASGLALAINLGDIETSGTGSVGMGAENIGLALNLGEIETEGEAAHGMQAQNLGIAVNLTGLPDLDGLDIIPLPDALLDILDEFGFFPGEIVTTGYGAHGMYAKDFSVAANLGDIFILGENPYAYGMLAEDFSLALNVGNIEIGEYGDEDMGGYSHGMGASNWSAAINAGSITTYPIEGAYGILAENNSIAVNAGSLLSLGGDFLSGLIPDDPEDPEDEDPFSGIIDFVAGIFGGGSSTIETFGYGSHGMVARNWSAAINLDEILTHGSGAYGMMAENFSLAANLSSNSIETWGDFSHGMVADTNSMALNTGSILTHGDYAAGMHAVTDSLSLNFGDIETEGLGSQGMSAHWGSTAFNFGSVTTTSDDAYGMWALYDSTIVNTGSIQTSGENSEGMHAFSNSNAFNFGEISTGNSDGIYVGDNSIGVNTGSVDTSGEDSIGIVAVNGSFALNSGVVTTSGERAHGIYAGDHSTAINTGSILTSGFESRGISAQDSIVMNTGSIETEGTLSDGIYGVNAAILNTGSVKTSGATSSGILLWEGSVVNTGTVETSGSNSEALYAGKALAVNTGTLKTTGANSAAAHIDENSLFINTGVLDSENGNAVTADGNSIVVLFDGTVLAGSHTLEDVDGDSDLAVLMDDDLAAQVVNFGSLTKAGGGTLLVEGGSSVVGDTLNAQGTIMIEPGTQFETGYYTQLPWSVLYVFANPDSYTNDGSIPFWVENDAWIRGGLTIDFSGITTPGFFTYIRADEYDADFDYQFVNLDPALVPYAPQWLPGGSWHYTNMIGYSFSQAALGMVAAIDDWSMLRHIMANHLQDVAESLKELEVGEKKIHAQVLAGQTRRDPSSETSAGFDSTQKGISVGFDKKHNETTAWGMYLGYTEKDIDFTGLPMVFADWENQNTWHIGGYISKRWDNWILSNTLTYRSTDHDTFRAQVGGDARASFDSWAITNDIRLGYVMKEIGEDSNWQIIPEVGLNVGHINREGYTEANGFTYGDYSNTVVESVVGIRFKAEYLRDDGSTFVPQLRLAWVHILSGEDITIDQTWGSDTKWFTETLDKDYFVADIGMSLYKFNNMDISLNYSGRFSDDSTSHGGWIRLQWEF